MAKIRAMRTRATEQSRDEERRGAQQRLLSDCSIRAMEGAGNERKFVLSFSSEEPYERWFGTEILSHSEGAVDLSRLNSIGCVLYNHNRDRVVGKIIRAWLEDNRGNAEIEFDRDMDSETVFQKVASGTLKGVSVGYLVDVQIRNPATGGLPARAALRRNGRRTKSPL